jgi:hypothetical protein
MLQPHVHGSIVSDSAFRSQEMSRFDQSRLNRPLVFLVDHKIPKTPKLTQLRSYISPFVFIYIFVNLIICILFFIVYLILLLFIMGAAPSNPTSTTTSTGFGCLQKSTQSPPPRLSSSTQQFFSDAVYHPKQQQQQQYLQAKPTTTTTSKHFSCLSSPAEELFEPLPRASKQSTVSYSKSSSGSTGTYVVPKRLPSPASCTEQSSPSLSFASVTPTSSFAPRHSTEKNTLGTFGTSGTSSPPLLGCMPQRGPFAPLVPCATAITAPCTSRSVSPTSSLTISPRSASSSSASAAAVTAAPIVTCASRNTSFEFHLSFREPDRDVGFVHQLQGYGTNGLAVVQVPVSQKADSFSSVSEPKTLVFKSDSAVGPAIFLSDLQPARTRPSRSGRPRRRRNTQHRTTQQIAKMCEDLRTWGCLEEDDNAEQEPEQEQEQEQDSGSVDAFVHMLDTNGISLNDPVEDMLAAQSGAFHSWLYSDTFDPKQIASKHSRPTC